MSTPSDIFRNSVLSILNNVNTAMPGIIIEYDSKTNKATVQPALNRNLFTGVQPMPVLQNVPLMFLGGSNFHITYPVKKGDYVLLIFCQRAIDLWLLKGGQVTPDDPRKFDLSDAIGLTGLQPFTGNFNQSDGNDFVISFGNSTISIKENGDIIIKTSNKVAIGKSTAELLDLFDKLLDTLILNIGNPAQHAQIATDAIAIKTLLSTIKGIIT